MPTKPKKQLPMEQILQMTKELNPDDFDDADFETGDEFDGQAMIEQRDDYNPDDDIMPNPIAIHLGDPKNDR